MRINVLARCGSKLHSMFTLPRPMVPLAAMLLLPMAAWASAAALASPSIAASGTGDTRELIRLVRQDCGSCHGMKLTGGLGAPLTRDALAGKPVEGLVATILYGRPGTAMPPWRTLLTETQAQWIAEQLLAGFPEEVK